MVDRKGHNLRLLELEPIDRHGLEGEVALGDHLSDLSDDLTLGVGQIDSLVPNINLTCFAVLPGLISLQQKGDKSLNAQLYD